MRVSSSAIGGLRKAVQARAHSLLSTIRHYVALLDNATMPVDSWRKTHNLPFCRISRDYLPSD